MTRRPSRCPRRADDPICLFPVSLFPRRAPRPPGGHRPRESRRAPSGSQASGRAGAARVLAGAAGRLGRPARGARAGGAARGARLRGERVHADRLRAGADGRHGRHVLARVRGRGRVGEHAHGRAPRRPPGVRGGGSQGGRDDGEPGGRGRAGGGCAVEQRVQRREPGAERGLQPGRPGGRPAPAHPGRRRRSPEPVRPGLRRVRGRRIAARAAGGSRARGEAVVALLGTTGLRMAPWSRLSP